MRLTKKYLINSILLILLLEWAFPIGFISPTNVPKVQAQTTKTLLQPSDFTYLGYYDVKFSVYGQGLTYRYVNGDLRFLTLTWDNGQGDLLEFSLAGKNLGDSIDTTTNTWPSLMSMGGKLDGLWWDDAKQRLWTESAISYNPNYENTNIITQTLNSNGTVSNVHGPISLEGIGAKRVFGGAQNVPTWFQQLYGVGPYVVGWGGITSLLAEGSVASLGGTMYAIPDPANYADNTIIPANQFKILMDHSSGSTSYDWYSSGSHPTSFDRGERSTVPVNYFDGGDTRPNGNCSGCNGTRPTNPPVPGAGWLSPAPDGIARWTWEDTYTNTGNWIDSTTKTGFVTVADLAEVMSGIVPLIFVLIRNNTKFIFMIPKP